MWMRSIAALVIAAGLLFAPATRAQESKPDAPAPTPESNEGPSIFAYGDVEKTCLMWTDGCRTCSRDPEGAPICSNLGIACQPKEIQCTSRQEGAPLKK